MTTIDNKELWRYVLAECGDAPASVRSAVYDAIDAHGWDLDRSWPWSVVLKRWTAGQGRQELTIYFGATRPTGADLRVVSPPTRIKRMADITAAIAAPLGVQP